MSLAERLLKRRSDFGKPGKEIRLGDQNPADGIGIGLTGTGAQSTKGFGVRTYVDELGRVEVIPQTESSFASGWLWEESDAFYPDDELMGHPYLIDPPINPRGEDELLHDQIHEAVPPLVRVPHVVNPSNPGIPNLGPEQESPAITAESSITPHYQSDEQGWGMEGRIAEYRTPLVTDPNPYYNIWNWRRNGALNFSSEGIPFGRVTNAKVQAIEELRRNRSSVHERVVDNPASVFFSETVPVEGQAGPIPEPLDINDYAIY